MKKEKCKRHKNVKPCILCKKIAEKAKSTREYWDGPMAFHRQPIPEDRPRWGSHDCSSRDKIPNLLKNREFNIKIF